MHWRHLFIAASVLGSMGCGGAPPADVAAPAAATNDHGHDHNGDPGTAAQTPAGGATPDSGSATRAILKDAHDDSIGAVQDQAAGDSQAADTSTKAATDRSDTEPAPLSAVGEVGSTGLPAYHAATTLIGRGDKLPELVVKDLDGNEVSIGSLKEGARVLVLVFWDSQIDLSKLELEYLEKHLATPRAQEGVRVVAINRGESPDVVRQVIEEHGITFPVLMDPDALAFQKLATKTVPRTYVVDSDGTVRNLWVGFTGHGTISEIEKEIDSISGE